MANPLLKFTHPDLKPDDPCPHMRTLVNDAASGTLTGLARLYTNTHINGCDRCARALAALNSVRAELHTLGDAPPPPLEEARRVSVAADWDKVDAKLNASITK